MGKILVIRVGYAGLFSWLHGIIGNVIKRPEVSEFKLCHKEGMQL